MKKIHLSKEDELFVHRGFLVVIHEQCWRIIIDEKSIIVDVKDAVFPEEPLIISLNENNTHPLEFVADDESCSVVSFIRVTEDSICIGVMK